MIDEATARRIRAIVRCPHCHAGIGSRCVVPSSGRPITTTGCHEARAEAFQQIRGAA